MRDLVLGRQPFVDVTPLSVDRFAGDGAGPDGRAGPRSTWSDRAASGCCAVPAPAVAAARWRASRSGSPTRPADPSDAAASSSASGSPPSRRHSVTISAACRSSGSGRRRAGWASWTPVQEQARRRVVLPAGRQPERPDRWRQVVGGRAEDRAGEQPSVRGARVRPARTGAWHRPRMSRSSSRRTGPGSRPRSRTRCCRAVPVRRERVGGPAGPVQRRDQQRPDVLAQRVLVRQRRAGRDRQLVQAERDLGARLQDRRLQPQLPEVLHGPPYRRVVLHTGHRLARTTAAGRRAPRTAPPRTRRRRASCARAGRGPRTRSRRRRPGSSRSRYAEPAKTHRVRADQAAQARDQGLQRVRGVVRRAQRPDRVAQEPAVHRAPGSQREQREQQHLPGAGDEDELAVGPHRRWTEQPVARCGRAAVRGVADRVASCASAHGRGPWSSRRGV